MTNTKHIQSQIEINEQFRRALEIMEDPDRNVFITGRAGTGKSTLLEYFRHVTEKKVAVLAPTGVAALNVKGQTIHSFSYNLSICYRHTERDLEIAAKAIDESLAYVNERYGAFK